KKRRTHFCPSLARYSAAALACCVLALARRNTNAPANRRRDTLQHVRRLSPSYNRSAAILVHASQPFLLSPQSSALSPTPPTAAACAGGNTRVRTGTAPACFPGAGG